jgi:hypothetical protein
MRHMFFRTASVCALAFFLFAAAAPGEEGTASGKLTVGGKTTPLSHAYALARKDTFDKTKENVLIVLSDVAIPDDALWEDFPGLKMAAAGKLHAVEVELNADKSVKQGGIVHGDFVDSQGYIGTQAPEFKAKTFDAKTVEGSFSSGKPQVFQNKKFEYVAIFRAPVLHRPLPAATGAAAAQSAPGKVVMEFLKAAASGDKAAIKKLLAADYGKALDGPNGKAILDHWKMNHPDPVKTPIDVVNIHGSSADVLMTPKASGYPAAKFTLVLEGGRWRIDSVMM